MADEVPVPSRATDKDHRIDDLLKGMTGRDRVSSVALSLCALCGEKATGFKDPASAREYQISSMCQTCQDSTFEE